MEWRGFACPPPLRSCRQLRGHVAVDVLVEPAGVRAGVAGEAPVRVLSTALHDVSAVEVAISAFTRIPTGNDIAPVCPDAVRERPDRADVEIVAAERNRPAAELLVVRVARDRVQPR